VPALKTHNLFISHCWDYNDEYYRLIEYLRAASNFDLKNFSVPEHDHLDTRNDHELEVAHSYQIRPTHSVLI
jgi:hypothetical protein